MNNITFATYNIRHGYDVAYDFSKIAENIHQAGADVVGLQEIDMGTRRSKRIDTLTELQGTTGMPYAVFTPAMDFDGGAYGTAILSRYPINHYEVLPLPSGRDEPRAVGKCILQTPWGEMVFCNTHLTYHTPDLRVPQFEMLAALLPKDKPCVVTGDFNTSNEGEFSPLTQQGMVMVNSGARRCQTFRHPPDAIDHILYHPNHMTLLASGMVDSPYSDHNLFYATFQIPSLSSERSLP